MNAAEKYDKNEWDKARLESEKSEWISSHMPKKVAKPKGKAKKQVAKPKANAKKRCAADDGGADAADGATDDGDGDDEEDVEEEEEEEADADNAPLATKGKHAKKPKLHYSAPSGSGGAPSATASGAASGAPSATDSGAASGAPVDSAATSVAASGAPSATDSGAALGVPSAAAPGVASSAPSAIDSPSGDESTEPGELDVSGAGASASAAGHACTHIPPSPPPCHRGSQQFSTSPYTPVDSPRFRPDPMSDDADDF